MIKIFSLTAAFLAIFFSNLVFANGYTQVGRYLLEKNGAQLSQCDPLQTVFKITFPYTVKTVGDAVKYLLNNTGYILVPCKYQSITIRNLLNQKLPLTNRTMGLMTIEQGLSALGGKAYQVLVDPKHKYISYQLRKEYQPLYLKRGDCDDNN
jgi:type IV pili sensor histidine kinase/response regulator